MYARLEGVQPANCHHTVKDSLVFVWTSVFAISISTKMKILK